jgi:vitamin B12 transporter
MALLIGFKMAIYNPLNGLEREVLDHQAFWQSYIVVTTIVGLIGFKCAFATETLPTVTVTAPRTTLTERINPPQLLDEDTISIAHERSITDVIQGLPGVNASRSGGYGQLSTLNIRSAGGLGVITLDGLPVLQSLPGLLNLDTLPTEAIQNVEIVKGLDAISRSFQPLGGSIHLTTQDRQETGAKFSMEGGSFGVLRETLQGALTGKLGRITLTLNRGDAFDGLHLANADTNPEREPFRFTQAITRFSSDITDRINWQGSFLYRKSWVGTDKLGLDANRRVAFKDDEDSYGKGNFWLAQNSFNLKLSPYWDSHLQVGFTQLHTTMKMGDMTNRVYLANWHNHHSLIDDEDKELHWQMDWGGMGRYEQGMAQPQEFDEGRTMASGFVGTEARYKSVSGQLGVRVEHFEQYGDHPLFKAAAAWEISPSLTLRVSGGTGYRIPSYNELLALFFGNLQLRPERSASGNLGLEWFPTAAMHITANGFYHRYDDLITLAYHPQRGPVSVNVPDASVAGVELDGQYAWTDTLNTGISYTFNDSNDLQLHRQIPLRPGHTGRVWGEKKFTQLPVTLWAEAVVCSSAWNDTLNTIPINQSVHVNASIRYAVSQQFEVYLRGENLTNNRQSQFYSTDMPGVAVYGGFQLKL